MLERMRDFSKSWVMKGLLGLVGLSFVAYFGATPFQKRQKERLFSAVKVNGEIISTQEFFKVYNQLRNQREQEQGWPIDEEQQREIAQQTLDLLIDRTLLSQWSERLGLKATDEEVRQRIVVIWNQLSGGRPLTEQGYRALLARFDYRSVQEFEEDIRRGLVQEKLGELLAQRAKVSEGELRHLYTRLRRQVKAVAVGFLPEDYLEQVEPTRDEVAQYFAANQERYRVPEQVQVEYIEIRPEQLRDEVMVVEERLEQFFNQNRSQYQIEPKASVDYVRFAPEVFQDSVELSEEEIRQYYEAHPERYRMPERIRVRYIPVAVQEAGGVNAPSQSMLQAEYLSDPRQFEQVEASLILLRLPEGATTEEKERILEELHRIRREIEQGKDFAEAARQYSQHETADEGGLLGYVNRGQLPRPLDRAVFSLAEGQMSAPVLGFEGYYLLKVHSKQVAPLEEVRDEVARRVAASQLGEALRALRGNVLPEETTWNRLRVLSTDFFERGKYINDLIGVDYYTFGDAAFRIKDGQTTGVIHGRHNLYIISRIETQAAQPRPLEEVREEVVRDLRAEQAPQVAERKAEEALGWIRREGLSFEEMAARVDLPIETTDYFSQRQPPAQLGPNPYEFVLAAFNLKPRQVSDKVVTLESGSYLLRGRPMQEARLPELSEVREQVERDYRGVRAVALARERAYEYLRLIEDQGLSLTDLARRESLQVQDSGLFSKDDSLPALAEAGSAFHRAAFSLHQLGTVLPDIVPLTAGPEGEVRAFYLLQLKERSPSYVPQLQNVLAKVGEDLQREMAAELARQEGEAFGAELRAAVVSSASPAFDLRAFAAERGYESFETPYFSELGYVPGIPGSEDSPQFTRTAFSLEPGQCSGLIPVWERLEPAGASEEARRRLTGYYVLQVVERQEPDFAEFEQQREALLSQLLQHRRTQSYSSWQEGLRAGAKIERNEAFIADYEQRVEPVEGSQEEVESATPAESAGA